MVLLQVQLGKVLDYHWWNRWPSNNSVVTLGANLKGTSAEAQFFNGTIYSARMYNRVLTKQEIKNNYEIDKSRFGM